MIGIEYVCSGNHARSPMAEVIAKEYVQQKGLAEKVNIYSSGSVLHPRFDQRALLEHRLMVVMLSLQGGIFQGRIADMAPRAAAEGWREPTSRRMEITTSGEIPCPRERILR